MDALVKRNEATLCCIVILLLSCLNIYSQNPTESEEETTPLVIFHDDWKEGLKNRDGVIVVPADKYDNIGSCKEGMLRVMKNGQIGFLDSLGTEVIPLTYNYVSSFHEGFAWGKILSDGKYGFIDKKGEPITPFIYDGAWHFFEGMAAVVKKGKIGFINDKGEEVIPCVYNKTQPQFESRFSEGLALVRKGRTFMYINKNNEDIFILPKKGLLMRNDYSFFSDGVAWVITENYGTGEIDVLNLINKNGQIIKSKNYNEVGLEFDYRKLSPYVNGYSYGYCYEYFSGRNEINNTKYFLLDKNIDIVVCCSFDEYGKESVLICKDNNISYLIELANRLYNNNLYELAYRLYKGQENDSRAQFMLGWMCQHGQGVMGDEQEAIKWYKKSKEAGAKRQLALLQNHKKTNEKKASMTWIGFEPTTKQKDYSFKIGIKSDSKIEGVTVYVNETLTRGIVPVLNDGFSMTIDRTVILKEGMNTIKVVVTNAGGTSVTEKKVTYEDLSVATIDWLNFSPTTTEKNYSLKAGIKSKSKIEAWTVSVNGVVEAGTLPENNIVERGINAVRNDGYDLTISKVLPLEKGENTIKIEVRNAGGVAISQKNVVYNQK